MNPLIKNDTMKNRVVINILPFILTAAILFSGCKKEEDPVVPKVIPQANAVNTFIWSGLHDYYLWNKEIPNLTNSKFNKTDSLNAFLNVYADPQDLFGSLLYKRGEVDKWSFLVDNSKDIDDWINGISESMGFDFMLGRIGSSDDLFGFVRYVYKDSPADKAGMKRGDIFLKVNDQQLTVGNYSELLFSTLNYKLSFATIADSHISLDDRTVTMTAVELQENPIHMDTVFTFNNQKVGYLVYNGFNANYDVQLNDVFKKFKEANIDQLVLDLRYNGGGSVQTSIYLASMIYSTDNSKTFAVAKYNEGLQEYLVDEYGEEALVDKFATTIAKTDKHPEVAINTLNLQKIYFIVSDNTASASELLINGLRPYMDVKVIGINTTGKYTGSITLKDEDENGHLNSDWAMQPIVVKYANSQGVSDFYDGLVPTINAEEDFAHLMPFGDPNETLLKVVLDDMQGLTTTAMTLKSAKMGLRKVTDSQAHKRFSKDMYINPDILKGLKQEAQ
jgi:C-terminal processing protease CtpA/Prc